MEFLSTPSARRATQCGQLRHQLLQDFYPRPPRGGRRLAKIIGHALNAISIHALREEGDGQALPHVDIAQSISIHALREEGDPGFVPFYR